MSVMGGHGSGHNTCCRHGQKLVIYEVIQVHMGRQWSDADIQCYRAICTDTELDCL
jgi:hypothetical protein